MFMGHVLLQHLPNLLIPPQFRTFGIATDFLQAQSLYTVAKLDIADYLGTETKTAEELAKLSNVHPESLCRLLRFMVSVGYFTEVDYTTCSFKNNRHSNVLMKSDPYTMKDVVIHMSDHYADFTNLLETVKVGAQTQKSKQYWANLETNARMRKTVANAMTQITSMENEIISSDYDFSKFNVIADIGGGNGHYLAYLLKNNKNMTGVLFDLPRVIEDAKLVWTSELNMTFERVDMISGSFFDKIPSRTLSDDRQIDAYIMRSILHDWSDDASLSILQTVRKAIPKDKVLLIIEIVFDEPYDYNIAKRRSDTTMQIIGGKERSRSQFERLLSEAGFVLNKVVSTRSIHSVVEAIPK
ncbi:O-methyltransferase [Acrasis kona]|uniref:O-methyltransferase n=1 Tax=Acrasis kona TaxID=1008807 RepID=A0AAW2YUG4_9EUKA